GDSPGLDVQQTLRFTSPQVAMESIPARLKDCMVGLICDFNIPCNCTVCLVVIFIVPVVCSPATWCRATHCSGFKKPPGKRSLSIKEYSHSSFLELRSSRLSRSSCWYIP